MKYSPEISPEESFIRYWGRRILSAHLDEIITSHKLAWLIRRSTRQKWIEYTHVRKYFRKEVSNFDSQPLNEIYLGSIRGRGGGYFATTKIEWYKDSLSDHDKFLLTSFYNKEPLIDRDIRVAQAKGTPVLDIVSHLG